MPDSSTSEIISPGRNFSILNVHHERALNLDLRDRNL